MRHAPRIVLTAVERRQLKAWARPASRRRLARRARIVLLAADGLTNGAIASRLRVHVETVARWRSRFLVTGPDGLVQDAPRGGAAHRIPRSTVRRIVRATAARTPAEGPPWSTRSLARTLHVNHMTVHRVWQAQGLGNPRPPSTGDVASGAQPRVDLVGAYVTSLARALIFSVDSQPAGGSSALPELLPNPTGNADFSGPTEASEEVVRAVGEISTAPPGPRGRTERESSLLVFLRGVERRARPGLRLEAVFDRPLARLGRRPMRWLAAHGRFRVYTAPRPEAWAGAVHGWMRRWGSAPLDRASFRAAGEFARNLSRAESRSALALERFAWRREALWSPLVIAPDSPDTLGVQPPTVLGGTDERPFPRRA
jgi:LuxR family transcriptional regulator, maltose regulon positive regulatory protein